MTQSPQGGQAAPMTTGYQTASSSRSATTDSAPSPSTPTSSTPWGSTSTSSAPGASGQWSSPPVGSSDAPTASVPIVQGTAARGTNRPPQTNDTADRSAAAARAAAARQRGPRRARLQLRHINPWTVLKFSCVLSIALFFVWLIVIGVLFGVLDGAGVIGKINDAYTTIQGGSAQPPVRASVVFGGAAIIGVVNIVLFIALTTVGSVVYNLCADLVGGIEITLSER
jgi:Transmembrane domain of unknown function (DUF3566)